VAELPSPRPPRILPLDPVGHTADVELRVPSEQELALIDDPDPDVREQVADELGATGNPSAGDALLTLLSDESPGVVQEALKSLADLRYEPAHSEIETYAQNEDLEVAGAAARALRALGDEQGAEQTIEYLSGFLDADDPEVRSTAVSQIGKLGGQNAVELLERALEDSDPDIRTKAHWYLAELL
jgi:HEAT repeat protein